LQLTLIYGPQKDERLSWPDLVVDGLPTLIRTIQLTVSIYKWLPISC